MSPARFSNRITHFLLAACLLLGACAPAARTAPPAASAGGQATAPLPAALPSQLETPAAAPATPAAPSAVQTTAVGIAPIPGPEILNVPWDDRSIFREGLVASEQGVLEGLPGASVYHIDLAIDPGYTTFHGREEVLYTNREDVPLAEIHLRLYPNLFGGRMSASNVAVNRQPVQAALGQLDTDLAVPLAEPLEPGGRVVLRLDFQAELPTDASVGYAIFAFADDVLSLSQFYPLIPAFDADGWHTEVPPTYGDPAYTDASFYVVRITAPASLVIAPSGRVVEQSRDGENQVLTVASGPARDFFIAASERYVTATATLGETTVSSYTFPEYQGTAAQTLDFTRIAFDSYSNRFGAYPYTAFNIVATPTEALGIEYPGEIILALSLYERDPSSGDPSSRFVLEATAAHEFAHQWFYGIVGDDQINQPWLDEAMAQYITALYFEDSGRDAAAQGIRQDWEARWSRVDKEPIPIGQPVASYTPRSYGAIVYGRGPIFLDTLANQMGEATFDAFLKDYFQAYRWGIATTAGFEGLAEKECACDLSGIFQEWVGP